MLAALAGMACSLAACSDDSNAEDEAGETGDGSETEDTGDAGDEGVDAEAVVSEALGYASFVQVNASSEASQHGLADTVNIWVPQAHEAAFRAIDPADAETPVEPFPAGTLIVKEHLDAEAAPVGMTIMFKGPEGYDPEHGDWWWGNANIDGTIVDQGAVDYCIACHTPRAHADWLFGLAPEDQS